MRSSTAWVERLVPLMTDLPTPTSTPPKPGQLTFTAPRRGKPPRHLADLTPAERREVVESLGHKGFRAKQLSTHYFERLVDTPDEMTDLPKGVRDDLVRDLLPTLLTPMVQRTADDGETVKSAWRLHDGAIVESVLMRYPNRVTICISSQAGCGMNCPFCATGQAGLTRNLSTAEIVEQVVYAARSLRRGELAGGGDEEERTTPLRVSNVVFMGMGEALANYKAAIGAIRRLVDPAPDGLGMSARGITMSTVGLVPAVDKLAAEGIPVTLALSLHAPDDELRNELVPINTRWSVDEAIDCRIPVLPGDEAPGVDRVRPHPRHQRPGLARRPAGPQAHRSREGLGARQPDPAQPDAGVEVDRVASRRGAAVRRTAPGGRHPHDDPGHPRSGHRRRLRPAGRIHRLSLPRASRHPAVSTT